MKAGFSSKVFSGVFALIGMLLASMVLLAAAPEGLFSVDDHVVPVRKELKAFKDGKPRLIAAIADPKGRQDEFVEDEVIVTTNSIEVLNGFLLRWKGVVLATYPPKVKGKPTRYLTRIDSNLASTDDAERWASASKYDPQAHYRVSTLRGIKLLAAVAKERAAVRRMKSSDQPGYVEHWVGYKDAITQDSLSRIRSLEAMLELNCGFMLQQQIPLLNQVLNDGPKSLQAEQQLMQQLPNDDCVPPPPTFALTNGLILPEVRQGRSFTFVLTRPANVAAGFSAEITSALGGFTSNPPYGGTLYSGSVYLNSDGNQLALYTQPTFVLPDCSRSETFTIRLTSASGVSTFQVTLPVRLEVPGLGIRNYNLNPGQNANITLCAAGDRGAMQWNWVQISGNSFPPQGLTFTTNAAGNAVVSGTPQVNSYHAEGAFRVQQGSRTASLGVEIVISVGFAPVLGAACIDRRVTPDVFFSCEMPRPLGYNSHTWTLAAGTLPAGASLVQRGSTWYLEGTVPFWSSQCAVCTPFDTVGLYSLDFNLTVPGFNGVAGTRHVTLDVGIPFNVWTQNTILRPSGWPTIANTADDNAERAQMVVDRITSGTFDIIALQEVFDEEQRDQISLGTPTSNYNLLWGPDEDDLDEESGVATIIKGSSSTDYALRQNTLWGTLHNDVFPDCEGADCWANKGFSVVPVHVSSSAGWVYIVNTHLNAAYDFPDQHSATRQGQLQRIMDYVNTLNRDYPVLFLGDLNMVAGSQEYTNRMSDVLVDFEDPIATVFGNAALPYTNDKTRNAYGHFWQNEVHILEHEFEDIYNQSGRQVCESLAQFGGFQYACATPIQHPWEQSRIDYMLIRQGNMYQLVMDSASLEDTPRTTTLCRDSFQPQYSDAGHGNLRCYLSDHFGLSASLRLVRH